MAIVNVSIERSNFIAKCMSTQMDRPAIVKELIKQYKVSSRTAYSYIEIVNMKFAKEAEVEKPYRKQWVRASMQKVYQTALVKGDLQAAIRALDRLAALDGLYAPEEIRVESKHTHNHSIADMTTGDARKELQGLMEERARMLGANGHAKKKNGRSSSKTN